MMEFVKNRNLVWQAIIMPVRNLYNALNDIILVDK